ncbi:MAG: universal stress protein [Flavobacteriales bacterium]|nr:universal stress protein [Flavobacteriales bacterium]
MKKIIVPIDFSDNTEYILNKTLQHLHKEEFEVILLHVTSIDIGFIIGDVGFQYLPELEETTLKNEAKQLKKISKDLNSKEIKNEAVLLQGDPADEILKYADENNADLIVMGSHGRSSFYEAFIGSVSHSVLKHSKIPVLLIPIQQD